MGGHGTVKEFEKKIQNVCYFYSGQELLLNLPPDFLNCMHFSLNSS